MSVKKVLKVILITFLVLLLVAVIFVGAHVFRNYGIISNLEDSLALYSSKTNYSVESNTTNIDGTFSNIKYYQKDGKKAFIVENGMIEDEVSNDEIPVVSGDLDKYDVSGEIIEDTEEIEEFPKTNKISMYYNGERIDVFYDTTTEKTVIIDSKQSIPEIGIHNNLETNVNTEKLFSSFSSRIETTEFNGKECYVVNGSFSPNYMYEEGKNEFIIEKDTGLCLKINTDNYTTEYIYTFDDVSDEVFEEPDIGKYSIKRED